MVRRFTPFIISILICFPGCTGTPGKTKLTPVIDSEWWRICDMPDLGKLQGPDPEKQHIVDHGFILAGDQTCPVKMGQRLRV